MVAAVDVDASRRWSRGRGRRAARRTRRATGSGSLMSQPSGARSDHDVLELLEAGDAPRRDRADRARPRRGSRGCPSGRGRGRGSARSTRTRPWRRPSSRRRATRLRLLSKSRPTMRAAGAPSAAAHATASAFSEYAETCSATATSSHGAVEEAAAEARLRGEADRVQHAVELAADASARARRGRSALVTSSSTTSGSVGSRRAARWVRLIARPNDVSTTSAPSSCARRATENAIDASLSTPVTRMRLPASNIGASSEPGSLERGVARGGAGGCGSRLVDEHGERDASTRRVSLAAITASTKPRSAARYGFVERVLVLARRARLLVGPGRRRRRSRASRRPWRICTAPGAPITAISARRPRDAPGRCRCPWSP